MPESPSPEQKLAELMEKVRKMPRGGDLSGLLSREIEELARLVEERALAEREAAASSDEAAFPPSSEPIHEGDIPAPRRRAPKKRPDGAR